MVGISRLGSALAAVALLELLTSCSGSGEPRGLQEGKTTNPAAPVQETAYCKDRTGDGRNGYDLTAVALKRVGGTMTLTFTTAKPMPTSGTALYAVDAWSKNGKAGRQLGVKFNNGNQIAHFVFNSNAATQQNISSEVNQAGKNVTATFPMSAIAAVGDTFDWSAVYNVNGNDMDKCPQPGGDWLHPRQATFPHE